MNEPFSHNHTKMNYGRILREYRLFPKKRLGQHFITDPKLLRSISSTVVPQGEWAVVEIGAGIGTLTKELCQRALWVYALEYDQDLKEASRAVMHDITNCTWIWGDALDYDLTGFAAKNAHPLADTALCGNLPYYLTSRILYSALVRRSSWARMVFLVQEEVGERMATQDSGNFGRLSLWCQYRTRVRIVRRVLAGAFLPKPDVDSCLVVLDLHRTFPLSESQEQFMDVLSRTVFSAKRKTLPNGLAPLFSDKKALSLVLEAAGIDPKMRPEQLGIEGFVTLTRTLFPLTL